MTLSFLRMSGVSGLLKYGKNRKGENMENEKLICKALFYYLSYLIDKNEEPDQDTDSEQLETILVLESLLKFKDEEQHERWSTILASYKFFEDFEAATMEIIENMKGGAL